MGNHPTQGGLVFYLVFLRGGGVKKHKIASHFLKLRHYFGPLRVKTTSHIGVVVPSKKEEKFPLLKNSQPRGGGGAYLVYHIPKQNDVYPSKIAGCEGTI